MSNEIDLTPSPRVLRMLGEIDFKAWQCLCEIIDNSIDSFSRNNFKSDSNKEIKVTLPSNSRNDLRTDGKLEVQDNGSGMSKEELNNSLKAGYSHNNSVDKMGLFGMGFNISTARLGGYTEILTSRKEDDSWLKVVIDFSQLEKSRSFKVPIETIPKKADEQKKHGTKVTISKLRLDHVKNLFNKKRISEKLGKIYGRVLSNNEITIFYHGNPCTPFKHCTWDKKRFGENKGNAIPAIIPIEETLEEQNYCHTCWVWLSSFEHECPSCQQVSALEKREKRVKGWIGVQRYFHQDHYGIDLIRNGRVIKELDKSFFYFLNEDEESELEYPVDGHQMKGRLVGELEIDFVQVTHQKDAFLTNSTDWKKVQQIVRGDSPLRPQVGSRRGFSPNESPLAKLYSAFKTAKAGIKNLVPQRKSGEAMLTDPHINELVRKYYEGESAYQSDEKWWELLMSGTKTTVSPIVSPDDPTGGNPFSDPEEEVEDPSFENDFGGENETHGEIEEEFDLDEELSRLYSLDDLFERISIRVKAESAKVGEHPNGFEVTLRGPEIHFRYWPHSKIYSNSLLKPADFLINELAYHFHVVAHNELSKVPITQIELKIREMYFPELSPSSLGISQSIDVFIENLRDHLGENISKLQEFNHKVLGDDIVSGIKNKLAQNELLDDSKINIALEKGEFMNYLSSKGLSIICLNYPHLVFDGVFFNKKVEPKVEDILSQTLTEKLTTIFQDILWLQDNKIASSKPLWRGHAKRMIGNLEILTAWR